MSTTTTKYKLVKPELTDVADITAMNGNWDTLDTNLDDVTTKNNNHIANTSNPHSVTKAQVGLGNVDNTSDANKPISTATQAALNKKQDAVSGVSNTQLGYLSGVTANVQTQINDKVAKAGDTLSGSLTFNNKSSYHALMKYRTVNNADYGVNVGCGVLGGEGIVGLECRKGASTDSPLLGRLEIGSRGVSYVNANGSRTYLVSTGLTAASIE